MSKATTKAAKAQQERECRSASYEHQRLTFGGKVEVKATSGELRDQLLKAIAPAANCFYDPGALTLLNEFEAALRADWERIEKASVRGEADKAIAAALGLPAQWRLL